MSPRPGSPVPGPVRARCPKCNGSRLLEPGALHKGDPVRCMSCGHRFHPAAV
jgi:uncharacterized protein (DUF983 family)